MKKVLLALAVVLSLCVNVFAVETKATGTTPEVKKEQKKEKKKAKKVKKAPKKVETKTTSTVTK